MRKGVVNAQRRSDRLRASGCGGSVLRHARIGYCHWGADEVRAVLAGWTGRAADAPERLTAAIAGLGYGDVHLVNRGKTGLSLALDVMKAQAPGRTKVLVPAYCCPAVPRAVRDADLEPLPIGVGDDLNLDIEALPAAVGADVLAIVAVHMYGAPLDVDAVTAIARPHGIRVIDDAAHVLGDDLGTRGDFGLLSFNQSKTLAGGAPNGGGALLVNAPELRDATRAAWQAMPPAPLRRRHHAWFLYAYALDPFPRRLPSYATRLVRPVAQWCEARDDSHSHMSETAAAAVLSQVPKLPAIRASRARIMGWYADAVAKPMWLPQYVPGAYRTRMIVAWDGGRTSREVRSAMLDAGISVRTPYPAWSDEAASLLGDRFVRQIELPCDPRLREADVRAIVDTLSRIIG
jgi:dTDP-4-amino-4,6-dideoxygalactose transaminase